MASCWCATRSEPDVSGPEGRTIICTIASTSCQESGGLDENLLALGGNLKTGGDLDAPVGSRAWKAGPLTTTLRVERYECHSPGRPKICFFVLYRTFSLRKCVYHGSHTFYAVLGVSGKEREEKKQRTQRREEEMKKIHFVDKGFDITM